MPRETFPAKIVITPLKKHAVFMAAVASYNTSLNLRSTVLNAQSAENHIHFQAVSGDFAVGADGCFADSV